MANKFKKLASGLAKMAVYSHDILETGNGFVLKVNGKFVGKYDSYAAAAEVVRGLAGRGGSDEGVLRNSTFGLESSPHLKYRTKDLVRRFYAHKLFSNPSINLDWNGWRENTVRAFVSRPSPTVGWYTSRVRAFGSNVSPNDAGFLAGFNANPSSPATTSPWHNILYENIIQDYLFGFRAFTLYMPFGSYTNTYNDSAPTMSWLCTPIQWEDNFTSGSSDPKQCPARWKGFWEAVGQLLNGTFPAPNGAREQITEPVDIHIYFNSCSSFPGYRAHMHKVWLTAGGASNGAGDAAVKSLLDRMIARIVSMKPSAGKGILSINLDSVSPSATPTDVHLYRSIPSYKSDFCELADWYVYTKLIAAGIPTIIESRSLKSRTVANLGFTISGVLQAGTAGTESYSSWGSYTSDSLFAWFTNPEFNPDPGYLYTFNTDTAWTHLLQANYMGDETKIPYGARSEVFNGASIRDLFANPAGYTPHAALMSLYHVADIIQDHYWRNNLIPQRDWYNRIKWRGFSTFSIDPMTRMGHPYIETTPDASFNGTTAGTSSPCRYCWQLGQVNYMPDTWNLATFQANPTTYSGGFWTTATKTWFNENIRAYTNIAAPELPTLSDWLDNISDLLCIGARPPNTPGTQTLWGQDQIYLNCIDVTMRTP